MTDSLQARADNAVEGLTPGYFALVMATGIISVGMRLEGVVVISDALLAVTAAGYAVLVVLTIRRTKAQSV